MPLSQNAIQDQIRKLAQKVQPIYPDLMFLPVIFSGDAPKQALQQAVQNVKGQSYETAVKIILQREFKARESRFLGVAIHKRKKYLGLVEQEKLLSLFSLKVENLHQAHHVTYMFWHMVSHSLDCLNIRQSPKYRDSFIKGPMIPKRPAAATALANLKADIFALLILARDVPEAVLEDLISKSCRHILIRNDSLHYVFSPLPLAIEQIYFALETIKTSSSPAETIRLARGLSEDIISAFDQSLLANWFHFTHAAQEMAWLNFKESDILAAAIQTSEKPVIRNLAGEMANLLNIDPSRHYDVEKAYNPFLSEAVNARTHYLLCESRFEDILHGVMADRSINRLYENATAQSTALLKGDGFGFSAHALIEVAKFIHQRRILGTKSMDAENFGKHKNEITEIFKRALAQLRWQDIHSFAHDMRHFIAGQKTVYYKDMYQNALKNPDHSLIAQALEECRKHNESAFADLAHISLHNEEVRSYSNRFNASCPQDGTREDIRKRQERLFSDAKADANLPIEKDED